MRKMLIILMLLPVGLFAQRIDWGRTFLNMGISAASIALEMSGDALYDMGKADGNLSQMRWGHTLQASGYAALLAYPFISERSDAKTIALTYLGMRFFMADAVYNSVRGLPLLYSGTTSEHDNILSQVPPHGRAFAKTVCFSVVIGININYW